MVTIRDKREVFVDCDRVKQKERWCSRLSKSARSRSLVLRVDVFLFPFFASFIRKSSPYSHRPTNDKRLKIELRTAAFALKSKRSHHTHTFSSSSFSRSFICTTSLLAATRNSQTARHVDKCNHVNTSALILFPIRFIHATTAWSSRLSLLVREFLLLSFVLESARRGKQRRCTYNVKRTKHQTKFSKTNSNADWLSFERLECQTVRNADQRRNSI